MMIPLRGVGTRGEAGSNEVSKPYQALRFPHPSPPITMLSLSL